MSDNPYQQFPNQSNYPPPSAPPSYEKSQSNTYYPPQQVVQTNITSAIHTAAQHFFEGNIIALTSSSSGRCLRCHQNGLIDGNGDYHHPESHWIVHAAGKHIRLQSKPYPNFHLRITVSGVDGKGGVGPYTLFNVIAHPNGEISLESAKFLQHHIGFLPSGHVKLPNQTGTGRHGRFQVLPEPVKVIYHQRNVCPACHQNVLMDEYTCCGLFWAVFCFPVGILCCLGLAKKRCVSCGFVTKGTC